MLSVCRGLLANRIAALLQSHETVRSSASSFSLRRCPHVHPVSELFSHSASFSSVRMMQEVFAPGGCVRILSMSFFVSQEQLSDAPPSRFSTGRLPRLIRVKVSEGLRGVTPLRKFYGDVLSSAGRLAAQYIFSQLMRSNKSKLQVKSTS